MLLTLYKTNDEPSKLVKNLRANNNIVGWLRDDCDIMNPVIEVEYDDSILSYNYAHLNVLNRYYYIQNMTISKKRIILHLHEDVLMTYASQIKGCYAHIIRTNSGDAYIIDNMIAKTAQVQVETRKLGQGFNQASQFLLTIGG